MKLTRFSAALVALVALLLAVGLLLVFTSKSSAASPHRHKHKDIISSGTTHRESLPISANEVDKAIGTRVISKSQQRLAIALALHRWHGSHCVGNIQFLHADLYPVNIIAQSEWQTGSSATPFYACKITLNARRATLTFPFFCAMMSHEYGHLAGYYFKGGLDGGIHSPKPDSVMYPILSGRNIPYYCQRTGTTANEKLNDLALLAIGSRGPRVRDLQWLLKGGKPSVYRGISFYHGKPTGVFGRPTAIAVKKMKFRLGWPKSKIHGVAGNDLIQILEGKRARPPLYKARAFKRLKLEPIHAETACAANVIRIARGEVGVHEIPPHSNSGPRVNQYQAITGSPPGTYWCANFDQWVFVNSGYGKFANGSGYVLYIRRWAEAHALLKAEPKIGALAIFYRDSHHIGIVSRVVHGGVYTIEGNSSDSVVERFRPQATTVMAFVWLPNCHYPVKEAALKADRIIPDKTARPADLLAPLR